MKRDEIDGEDTELSEIEEFILMEIEQQQNADLMIKLEKDEFTIKNDIYEHERKLRAKYLKHSKTVSEIGLLDTMKENHHLNTLKLKL